MFPQNPKKTLISFTTVYGLIEKREIRERLFNNSKYKYLNAINDCHASIDGFTVVYDPYHEKHLIPKKILKMILTHLDIDLESVQFSA